MKNKGPHRKRIKHFHKPGDLHAFTFSCFEQRPLLTNDDWRKRLSRSIDEACIEYHWELAAFVYMPEHVHLLVVPKERKPAIDDFLLRIKQPFSAEIKAILERRPTPLLKQLTVEERPGKVCFRFWQEGPGFDRNLSDSKAVSNTLDYFHLNPVKRGLCKRAIDWSWSSARYNLLEPPKQQFPGLPFIHGLPAGMFS
jgi:putative transposase